MLDCVSQSVQEAHERCHQFTDGTADMREQTHAKLITATDIAAWHDGSRGVLGAQAPDAVLVGMSQRLQEALVWCHQLAGAVQRCGSSPAGPAQRALVGAGEKLAEVVSRVQALAGVVRRFNPGLSYEGLETWYEQACEAEEYAVAAGADAQQALAAGRRARVGPCALLAGLQAGLDGALREFKYLRLTISTGECLLESRGRLSGSGTP